MCVRCLGTVCDPGRCPICECELDRTEYDACADCLPEWIAANSGCATCAGRLGDRLPDAEFRELVLAHNDAGHPPDWDPAAEEE